MKKLALIVIIAALSTLMAAAITTASDERFDWWVLQGTYEMIATGSCLHSTDGFIENPAGPPFIPKPGSTVWGATTTAVATWVLYYDGTGYIAGINYPIDFPPGSPFIPSGGTLAWGPRARQGGFNYDIKYHLSGSDIIFDVFLPPDPTIDPPREKYAVKIGEWEGSVSFAKQTITVPTVNQVFNFTTSVPSLYWAVCNTARVLIRVGLAPKKP
jgi:hypothetical protein